MSSPDTSSGMGTVASGGATGSGAPPTLLARVCVVGGGPAGLMLALELATRDCDVVVLEQSGTFNRSFRGESISPDSVWLLRERGVLEALSTAGPDTGPGGELLEVHRLEVHDGGEPVLRVDYSTFDYPQRYPAELPQPMLLSALAAVAERSPAFRLLRRATVVRLLEEDGRAVGVVARTADGEVAVRAEVVVGADGRYSTLRDLAGITFTKIPLERDFLWFKVPCPAHWDRRQYRVCIAADHHALVIPTYPDLLRIGFNIPKDGLRELRSQGIEALHERMHRLVPELGPVVAEHVTRWSDTSMLEIFTTVVPAWYRGRVLLIGDAAHTLSPVLAQGVNHALLDAAALGPPLAAALQRAAGETEITEVFRQFQRSREPLVRRARTVQQRQERAFTASSRVRVRIRKSLYRLIDRSTRIKAMMWRQLYYDFQESQSLAAKPRSIRKWPPRPRARQEALCARLARPQPGSVNGGLKAGVAGRRSGKVTRP